MYINRRLKKAFSVADIKEAPAEFYGELRRVQSGYVCGGAYAKMLSYCM
ncbi:conserved hypothetical protein [Porphyromonas gingivalis ATCC 33277]|uniref:Uncharacterized protein n=1 Tax=Porphyromonas gingivalis (strain ATCC 33277 / DSM 20709 / CIP 103683 / JCM 12257 / NCTC 11834 / 2561) TaxID=431947 RepID=B2RIH6_PORG3|nr:conserved hypothetical protein [Porphyromonas gingivalis ATCC 33277]